jgi:hypothetical protein
MPKSILTICWLGCALHAQTLSPKAEFTYNLETFFPSNQKMFIAEEFQIDSEGILQPIDTLVPMSNFLKWLPGQSITGKFEILTFLHLGVKIKLEHYFNRYNETFYGEFQQEMVSTSVIVNIFNVRGGLFSSITLFNYLKVEPEAHFLFVKNHFRYHLIQQGNDNFCFSVNKTGFYSALNLLYSHSENVKTGLELDYVTYSEFYDFLLNPYVRIKINGYLCGNAGLSYSPMTGSFKPMIGINLSIP